MTSTSPKTADNFTVSASAPMASAATSVTNIEPSRRCTGTFTWLIWLLSRSPSTTCSLSVRGHLMVSGMSLLPASFLLKHLETATQIFPQTAALNSPQLPPLKTSTPQQLRWVRDFQSSSKSLPVQLKRRVRSWRLWSWKRRALQAAQVKLTLRQALLFSSSWVELSTLRLRLIQRRRTGQPLLCLRMWQAIIMILLQSELPQLAPLPPWIYERGLRSLSCNRTIKYDSIKTSREDNSLPAPAYDSEILIHCEVFRWTHSIHINASRRQRLNIDLAILWEQPLITLLHCRRAMIGNPSSPWPNLILR